MNTQTVAPGGLPYGLDAKAAYEAIIEKSVW